MAPKLVVYLCVIILTFGLETLASTRSSFGEECSKAKKCDRKAWLSCYNGVCDCSRPEEMFFDEVRGKCVTKSGERCKYGVDEDGESSLVELTDCVTNSKCEEDGICTCDSRFHEVFNGTCQPSKSLGQSCSEEDKCSKYLHLHCINGVCKCQDRISVYSSKIGQCVGALTENCVDGKCLDGAECREGKCFCNIDHYESTSAKTCVLRKSIHEECSNDSECIHKGLFIMKCIKGKCGCGEGYKFSKVQKSHYTVQHQYRDYGSDRYFQLTTTGPFVELCAPLVGKECSDGFCVVNAECRIPPHQLQQYYESHRYSRLLVLSHISGVCQCRSEYPTPNKDNSGCGKNYDQSNCETNDDCVNNLLCYNSKCQCASSEHQKVNAERDYCHTKIGAHCSDSSECISDSHCKLLPNSTVGQCLCNEGFVDSIQGECELIHGSTCDYSYNRNNNNNVPCDQFAGLVCINHKCSCKDNFMYKYSETLRKCVGLVGANCQGKNVCVANAECLPFYNNLELPGRCQCKPGFVVNKNFNCEAKINHAEL